MFWFRGWSELFNTSERQHQGGRLHVYVALVRVLLCFIFLLRGQVLERNMQLRWTEYGPPVLNSARLRVQFEAFQKRSMVATCCNALSLKQWFSACTDWGQ